MARDALSEEKQREIEALTNQGENRFSRIIPRAPEPPPGIDCFLVTLLK